MRPFRLLITAGVLAAVAAVAPAAAVGKGAWTFASVPSLHPAKLQLDNTPDYRKLAPGYFMLAIYKDGTARSGGQSGPLIVDSHLQPVWFKALTARNLEVTNLMVQSYAGKPVLSWWQARIAPDGSAVASHETVVDQHYRVLATLTGRKGWVLDPHEFVISGRHAWVTAYKAVPVNLTAYGGPVGGFVADSAVQEYDLKTGKLVYSWSALAHIPLADSYIPAPSNGLAAWDAYHVNSLQLLPGGRFVISARATWGIYEVDAASGHILWTLGGKHSDYAIPAAAQFQWQHMATLHSNGRLTVFDNHCCNFFAADGTPSVSLTPARGLLLKLDRTTHSVSLVREYHHNPDLVAAFQGSTQLLGNGNVVVGWGIQPYLSEYSPTGALLLDARLPDPDASYRAIVQRWVGRPSSPPNGAAFKRGGAADIYASWNGATGVVSWRALGGSNAHSLKTLGTASKSGFETKLHVAHKAKVYEVQALDGRGHVLGTSKSFTFPKPPPTCFYNC